MSVSNLNQEREGEKISLLEAVQIAAFAEENGCRVHSDGKGTIIVCDCFKWGKDNMNVLLFFRPTAEVSIHSSVNSLSGFKIIIHEPIERSQFFFRALIALLSSIIFTLFFCFTYDYLISDIWKYILKCGGFWRDQKVGYTQSDNNVEL